MLHSGRLCPNTNIRVARKQRGMENTLAYFETPGLTKNKKVKKFYNIGMSKGRQNIQENDTYKNVQHNEGKLAASFCRQVHAWVPDMFYNFC